ncbi:hypothetical protein [Deinococcus aluminii]|uniref:Uncharacterized protein n=1 Tax=Deinococcus aluminii TaxID=1656885 RepID=A0ABP9XH23_9DEIO
MKPAALGLPLLLAAALLVLTWQERHDPLDLGVVGAGLVGLGLLLWLQRGRAGQGRLAVSALVALLAGVALFGVRDPLPVLGFAVLFALAQLLVRRLLGGR